MYIHINIYVTVDYCDEKRKKGWQGSLRVCLLPLDSRSRQPCSSWIRHRNCSSSPRRSSDRLWELGWPFRVTRRGRRPAPRSVTYWPAKFFKANLGSPDWFWLVLKIGGGLGSARQLVLPWPRRGERTVYPLMLEGECDIAVVIVPPSATRIEAAHEGVGIQFWQTKIEE